MCCYRLLTIFLLAPSLYFVELIVKRSQENIELSNNYVVKLASEIYLQPLLESDFASIMSLTLGFIQDEKIVNVAVYNANGINVTYKLIYAMNVANRSGRSNLDKN
jgi:hypothetical protein